MATVVLVGTLDTKGIEYGFLRDRLEEAGVDVLLVDAGILGEPQVAADVDREEVARAGGADHAELVRAADRGAAVDAMGRGAAAVLARLHAEGRLDGAAAVGGSGNSSIAAQAMRDLPVGVPKLIVSTVASGDTRPYVGAVDVTMMYSVVDISGINSISSQILTNAAGAIAGHGHGEGARAQPASARSWGPRCSASPRRASRPRASAWRSSATRCSSSTPPAPAGSPSRRWPPAASSSARSTPRRPSWPTTSSAACSRPGPIAWRPSGARASRRSSRSGRWTWSTSARATPCRRSSRSRNLYVHNPTITLMRTTPEEMAELGRRIAAKLNGAESPTVLFVPLKGVSAIDVEGQPFHDAQADEALFAALREGIDPGRVEVHEVDADVNDPAFATAMADRLHELIQEAS